ncbi:sensor histidine kinase [Rhodomicrobium vannielii]|nr:CHASE3 domain-containing protein [Rhodomicrobium vannielii]
MADLPKAPFLLGAAFAVLILIALVSIALLERTQGDRDRLLATVETEAQLDQLLADMRRLESGQRGYILTGDAEFLTPYRETLPRVDEKLTNIEAAIGGIPAQVERLGKLKPLIQAKRNELAESIRLFDAGKPAEAIGLVRGGLGLRIMDNIRDAVYAIKRANADSRAEQYAQSRSQEQWLLGTNIAAVGLIVLLGGVSLMMIHRANLAMRKAQNVLRNANSELEAAVAARTAELTAANEEIQKFAYIVSHDLRSPLVNIMGFTSELETLKGAIFHAGNGAGPNGANGALAHPGGPGAQPTKAALEEDFTEAIGFIKASITKMDRLINAVLTISREGNRSLKPERVDMNDLFQTIRSAIAHQAQEAEADIALEPLPSIVSDRLALEQIFSNLVDNALKYLRDDEKGRIRVTSAAHGGKVTFEVKDNGRGIAPRDQGRIFELFRRAGTQDKPGEGMGLAHVRALVRRLGGSISVHSTPGEGSVFSVTLPRTLPNQSKRIGA